MTNNLSDIEIAKRVEAYFISMINVNISNSEYSIWNPMVNSTFNFYKEEKLTEELLKFGDSVITIGVNIHDYNQDPQNIIDYHQNYHEKQLIELTNIPLESLLISKTFNINGKTYENDTNLCIPVTAYRLAYYVHRSMEFLDKNKRNIVLEIGGGFGLTSLIFNRNMKNSCYIIIDIPTTGILSAFFLIKMGLNVCLYGEYNTEDYEDLINKYDVIIIHPYEIEKFKENSIDIVINTASLVEMNDLWVQYYIKNISRIAKRFYNDNNFVDKGRKPLDKYCNEYLSNFNIIYKQITPINFLHPPILRIKHKKPFEEVLRIKNDII
jgi:putative sugar O-methyltransferase